MRVTVLGTGSADGWPNPFCSCRSCTAERAAGRTRRPSSALVDGRVLIDCGPTTPHLPPDVTLVDVEHVLITHGHPDHLHPAFLLSRAWTHPERVLHVWGPARALDLCRDWLGPGSTVDLHVLAPGDEADLPTVAGRYRLTAMPAAHAHGDGDVLAEEALLYAVAGPDGTRLLYATDTGPFDPAAAGVPSGPFDIVLLDETFGDKSDHGTGHLDLARLPAMLAALQEHGTITESTVVGATHLSHHNPPTDELSARLTPLGVRALRDLEVLETGATRTREHTLVLGGARSGKSHFAEGLLTDEPAVTYVATGGTRPGDAEWAERVSIHRSRRPHHWVTVESTDVPGCLAAAGPADAVLVDCLALWLTAVLDDVDAWQRIEAAGRSGVLRDAHARLEELVSALGDCRARVVLVTNEVGMGVVPATAAGRLFRDLLGVVNVRVAAACDETVLVVAGQPMRRSRHA
jgi:adenosylcobinamide kinase/adenosylcobinamide-phosphate guanylyltransferase